MMNPNSQAYALVAPLSAARRSVVLLLAFVWGGLPFSEAVPLTLTYQGQVVVADALFEGEATFKFALLDGNENSVWSNDGTSVGGGEPETGVTVNVMRGVYAVRLGDTGMQALEASVFDEESLSVRIWLKAGGDEFVQLSPDREMGSVAFSMKAARADYALLAGSVETVPNIDASKITSGSLSDARLPAGLARDSEVDSKLAAAGFSASQITSGTVADARLPTALARDSELDSKISAATFDASRITSGIFSDERISSSIARVATLTAQVESLQAQIDALSNQGGGGPVGPVVLASTDANDAELIEQGYRRFSTVESEGWEDGSSAGQPSGRNGHSFVWADDKLIVFGGEVFNGVYSSTGGIYSPASDSWSVLSSQDAPSTRSGHSSVWTGEHLLVWGGVGSGGYLSDGKRFDPDTNLWAPMNPSGTPSGRKGHVSVLVDGKLLVWGGVSGSGLLDDGGIYDTDTDSWVTLPSSGAPPARQLASGTWTGDELVVWGGLGSGGAVSSGAVLEFSGGNPASWTAMSSVDAPSSRSGHTAVWSGEEVLIFGGEDQGSLRDDGFTYDPESNSWSALSGASTPSGRTDHAAVWTGSEMIIMGGQTGSGASASCYAYSESSDSWRSVESSAFVARSEMTAVWSGDALFVFGGKDGSSRLAALQRIDPSPTIYLFRTP
ncbi:kelch repeat protein [Verrucomicrobiia bacterium DG1235]|nr:kelch repeat protein [Verrucomicrobiae bacterium DG1235]